MKILAITAALVAIGYDNVKHPKTTDVTNFAVLDGHGGLPVIITHAKAGQRYCFQIDAPSTPTDKGVTLGASMGCVPAWCRMLITEDPDASMSAEDPMSQANTVVPGSWGARWKTAGGRFTAAHLCKPGVKSYLIVVPMTSGDIALEVH